MVTTARLTLATRNTLAALLVIGLWALPPYGFAAETVDSVEMTTTLVNLQVDSESPLRVRPSFQTQPPTITLTFPKRKVIGNLPERSMVAEGVIQTITARYESAVRPRTGSKRFLHSIQIELSAPYPFRVRSSAGRVVVEIHHPASVRSTAVEVGLMGGTVIGSITTIPISERFRAMQAALATATPMPWRAALRMPAPSGEALGGMSTRHEGRSGHVETPLEPREFRFASRSETKRAGRSAGRGGRPAVQAGSSPVRWLIVLSILSLGSAAGLWWFSRRRHQRPAKASNGLYGQSPRLPSGIVLIDQLVWRAFERQGHSLILEKELAPPLAGTLRVILKDSVKVALLFVGHGPFFEKQTVERFIRIMGEAGVEQGILVAAGSFTVPAQRVAEERQVTLIGREQLTELLSAGAGREHFTRLLERSRVRLEESNESLRQHTNELEALRRQRNQASWRLGEERQKTAGLESQTRELRQQLQRHHVDLTQSVQDVSGLRKQWEESQWYLGESAIRVHHLEAQLATLQEMVKCAGTTTQMQQELHHQLDEEQTRRQALEQRLAILQTQGNRRARVRTGIPQAFIELYNGTASPIFSGIPRDVSSTGIGLEADQALPDRKIVRILLRFPDRKPIHSKGRLMWQHTEGRPTRYLSGYKLIGLSVSWRAFLERMVSKSQVLHT